ncbi:MAG: class I SAM-dependent methyltransferase [Bifidobacteriaceae bacterium]|jgi:ubiquinone/menaquinone biosynthesis C-methylase UbiE|nr:class I SAM-dependent methyltransferase [Bifidobacteriaceae bacterium]
MTHQHGTGSEHHFGARAEAYDAGPEGRLAARFYRRLLSALNLPDGARVLDVGCGTGRLLKLMAEQWPIAGHGLDAAPEMVRVAQRQCPDMDIRLGTAEALPFADGSMDLVTTCLAYHHFPDRLGFLAEAARVLAANGRLAVTEPRFPLPAYTVFRPLLRHIDEHAHFLTVAALQAEIEAAGFKRLSLLTKHYVQVQLFAL